jgi:hypothetical protein
MAPCCGSSQSLAALEFTMPLPDCYQTGHHGLLAPRTGRFVTDGPSRERTNIPVTVCTFVPQPDQDSR